MRKIAALLLCALLMLGTGCTLLDFVPSSTSSVALDTENISSSVSAPADTSSGQSITNTTSNPQNTSSKNPQQPQSITGTTSSNTSNTTSTESNQVTINPYAENTCYNTISAEQQRLYRIMLSAIKNVTVEWIWLGNCSDDYLADIAVAYRAVTYDYPELFWVPYTYVVNKEKGNPGVRLAFELTNAGSNKKYLVEPYEVDQKQAELNKKTQNIIDEVEKNAKTPYQKVLYLHDLLINNITYSHGRDEGGKTVYDDMAYTVYGALVNRDAVCEGYAKAMSYLCKKMGIECILVTGVSKDQGHMWNLVELEGKWYHIDVTWDDAEKIIEYPLHAYFCLTDEQIKADHTIDPDVWQVSKADKEQGMKGYNFGLPECTATKYNYFEQKNYYLGDDLAAAGKLIEDICRQEYCIELKFKTPEQLAQYEALDKEGREIYILALSKNVDTNVPNWKFKVKQYALIKDCLYIEW